MKTERNERIRSRALQLLDIGGYIPKGITMKTTEKQLGHSPAPWVADEQGFVYHTERATENLVAQLFDNPDSGLDPIDHEQSDYNQHLICAAPELLESLGVMTMLCRLRYGNLDADIYAEIMKAESAITKATGGAR